MDEAQGVMNGQGSAGGAGSLHAEVDALREALSAALGELRMAGDSGDLVKAGSLVARLCDSLVRALLAEQKLGAVNPGEQWLQAELDRVLTQLDYKGQAARGGAKGGEGR
jgi:hypothetical protein